jgi:hypothetical protein
VPPLQLILIVSALVLSPDQNICIYTTIISCYSFLRLVIAPLVIVTNWCQVKRLSFG